MALLRHKEERFRRLVERLDSLDEAEVVDAALELGGIDHADESAYPKLVRLLEHRNDAVRTAAVHALRAKTGLLQMGYLRSSKSPLAKKILDEVDLKVGDELFRLRKETVERPPAGRSKTRKPGK
jgi:hypothetical protein